MLDRKKYDARVLVQHGGVFYSWLHHGSVSALSEDELINKMNAINEDVNTKLSTSDFLFITLGSAWAYQLKEDKRLVANCHKAPANNFEKVLIETQQIVTKFEKLILKLESFNPKLKIILTVSPVRHAKDGLIENNLSKAELIKAVHELCKLQPCYYLPVYEWVIDDLRDYRFYDKDLVHPNSLAQDYIWEQLSSLFFSEETKQSLKKVSQFVAGVNHHPFQENSAKHISFMEKLLTQGEELERKLGVDLSQELHLLSQKLKQ